MAHVLKLVQGATTVDFQTGGDYGLNAFDLRVTGPDSAVAALDLEIIGTSADDLYNNLIALQRLLTAGLENKKLEREGNTYTPVWLQYQSNGATNLVQSECFGLADPNTQTIENILSTRDSLRGNRLRHVRIELAIRPYWEETAAVTVYNAAGFNISAFSFTAATRGDLAAPIKVTIRPSIAGQKKAYAAIRTQATPTSFMGNYELNTSASANHSVTLNATYAANSTTADAWGSKDVTVTPTAGIDTAAEIALLATVLFTGNVANTTGQFRAFIRAKDNDGSTRFRVRLKSITVDSSSTVLYRSDYAKAAAGVPAASGNWCLIDCGIINLPPQPNFNTALYRPGIEIYGYTTQSSPFNTFLMDELILMPVGEAPDGGGYVHATFSAQMGTATPDGVIDANDRTAGVYLVDGSGYFLCGADKIAGGPLYCYPNRTHRMQVILTSNADVHNVAQQPTITVTYTPRFRLARGS